jgi:hypothetical protein
MTSLHNLWRFRVAFAAVLALEGAAAVALGAARVWPAVPSAVLALAGLLSAALMYPRGRFEEIDGPGVG